MHKTKKQEVSYKIRKIDEGDGIILLDALNTGLITVSPLTYGKIVHCKNQVEADVWFVDHDRNQSAVINTLRLPNEYRGMVFKVKSSQFAVTFRYSKHENLTLNEENAQKILFFKERRELMVPSRKYIDDKQVHLYLIEDVIDVVEENFSQWVKQFAPRELTNTEIEDGSYAEGVHHAYSEKNNEIIVNKKKEVEYSFAKVTGVYVKFNGGLIWE
jgi:hypothetical protein